MADTTFPIWTLERLRQHRSAIIDLASKYGAYDVRVFGSIARGEATPDSDVDILVATKDGVTMFDLVGLWLDLQDLLGAEVSLITDDEHAQRKAFMINAKHDAVRL